jgi:predicted CXXCH cytochrome family protein
MPVREGKLQCSSCHNVHGTSNVRLLKVGATIDESCVSCHAEKRGPYLWEHAPVAEACVTCHDPHSPPGPQHLLRVRSGQSAFQVCLAGIRRYPGLSDFSSIPATKVSAPMQDIELRSMTTVINDRISFLTKTPPPVRPGPSAADPPCDGAHGRTSREGQRRGRTAPDEHPPRIPTHGDPP